MKEWELSYYVAPLGWDGKKTTFDERLVETEFETLRKAGISWAGFNGAGHVNGAFPFDLGKVVGRIVKLMKINGIRVSSFHFAGATVTDPDVSQETLRDNMRKDIEAFAPFKPKAFVVHSWWPEFRAEGDFQGLKTYARMERKYGHKVIWKTIAGNLKFMAKVAARHKNRIALETGGNRFPAMHDNELPSLLEMIDEPNAGYCLDSGHVHAFGGNVVEVIKVLGNRIFETHLHDNRALGADSRRKFTKFSDFHACDEHLSPSFGTIPWVDVINALRDVGFPGPATFETRGWPYIKDKVESYRQAIAWWRTCEALATEKRKCEKHVK
jgi:sugar phosphate isomerase/epimerase